MANPLISIVLATNRGGPYLMEALASVGKQSFTDWELILLDDCTPANSKNVIHQSIAPLGSKAIVLEAHSPLGVCRARDIGVHHARGKYIAFLDDDDYWKEEKLALQVEVLEQSQGNIAICHTAVETIADEHTLALIRENSKEVTGVEFFNHNFNNTLRDGDGTYQDYFQKLITKNFISFSSTVVARQALLEVGGFDNDLPVRVEDWSLWLKCSLFYHFYFLDLVLTYYRIHPKAFTYANFIARKHHYLITQQGVIDAAKQFATQKQIPWPTNAERTIR